MYIYAKRMFIAPAEFNEISQMVILSDAITSLFLTHGIQCKMLTMDAQFGQTGDVGVKVCSVKFYKLIA